MIQKRSKTNVLIKTFLDRFAIKKNKDIAKLKANFKSFEIFGKFYYFCF